MKYAIAVLLALALAAPIGAQYDYQWGIRTKCAPFEYMAVVDGVRVKHMLGITDERVEEVVKMQLERLRLPVSSTGGASLYYRRIDEETVKYARQDGRFFVSLATVGNAFQVTMIFTRVFPIDGENREITVWSKFPFGTHGRNGEFVLDFVAQSVGDFAMTFFRLNAPHCQDIEPM